MSNAAHPNAIQDMQAMPIDAKEALPGVEGAKHKDEVLAHTVAIEEVGDEDLEATEEEIATLRKVPAAMPWPAVAMCLIEFAERASYYGSVGPFGNFVRAPLPKGSPGGTGAVAHGPAGLEQKPGALGKGPQAATAISSLFTFLAYTIPIFGGIVSDTKWGRFKTIVVGTIVGGLAHVLLVIPAIPKVIASGNALAPFLISILILAFAAGFIKPSLGPLLCDQSPVRHPTVKKLHSGERVIVDPATTVQRYLLVFYWSINIGAFFALATTYAEHDIGFWLAFLLPAILYALMPIVLIIVWKRLYKAPPQGSVLTEAKGVVKHLLFVKGGWKRCWKGGDDFWNRAKPSYIRETGVEIDTKVVYWDDRFVDELRQSFDACKIFFLIPIFGLSDGGIGSTTSLMSVAMKVNGAPNDLMSNFNSLSIVIFTPLINYVLYPWLEKRKIRFTPMWRICVGFMLGSISMMIGAILQWRIYTESACGYEATTRSSDGDSDCYTDISLWWQIPMIVLPAIGELFVMVTSYELAYTRAPARMKGLIYAACLFTSAISSALTLALNPILLDPYLIWPYVALAIASFVAGFCFPIFFKHLDKPVVFNDFDRMEGKQQPNQIDTLHTPDDEKKA